MNDTKYNGWTNYATWRVNLEMFDGVDVGFISGDDSTPAYDLAPMLKEYAETFLYEATGYKENLALDYALAFISDVNWYEIAKNMEMQTEEH